MPHDTTYIFRKTNMIHQDDSMLKTSHTDNNTLADELDE